MHRTSVPQLPDQLVVETPRVSTWLLALLFTVYVPAQQWPVSSVTGLSGPALNDKELRRQQKRLQNLLARGLTPSAAASAGLPVPAFPLRCFPRQPFHLCAARWGASRARLLVCNNWTCYSGESTRGLSSFNSILQQVCA